MEMSETTLSAALKYFLLSALSTGLLFLGILFIYIYSGSTQYDSISTLITYDSMDKFLNIGSVLIMGSLLLKLAAAPMHNYAIDLYDALPQNIAMYMMIIPKLSVLTLLYILASMGFFINLNILTFSAILSLIIGSLGLISQLKIKRFFAYSGLNHLGFILLAFYCNDMTSFFSYQVIYATSLTTIFLMLICFSGSKDRMDLHFINQLAGFYRINPL